MVLLSYILLLGPRFLLPISYLQKMSYEPGASHSAGGGPDWSHCSAFLFQDGTFLLLNVPGCPLRAHTQGNAPFAQAKDLTSVAFTTQAWTKGFRTICNFFLSSADFYYKQPGTSDPLLCGNGSDAGWVAILWESTNAQQSFLLVITIS